jgi:hypothetical protein
METNLQNEEVAMHLIRSRVRPIGAFLVLAAIAVATYGTLRAQENPSKLLVVWTSGDREVALKMVYMYTYNAKKNGWWDEIRFLVWGPSSKLLSEDTELQEYIKKMKEEGVELMACKACADAYGVSDKLESFGVNVHYTGKPLTEMLKSDWVTVTF